MTPFEKLTGRKLTQAMVHLGEVVLAQFASRKLSYGKIKAQNNKLMMRSIRCILFSQMSRTGELIVIKPNGEAARCRKFFRVPLEDRWDAEAVTSVHAALRRASDDGVISAPLTKEVCRVSAGTYGGRSLSNGCPRIKTQSLAPGCLRRNRAIAWILQIQGGLELPTDCYSSMDFSADARDARSISQAKK